MSASMRSATGLRRSRRRRNRRRNATDADRSPRCSEPIAEINRRKDQETEGSKETEQAPAARLARRHPGEANMIAIIGIAWLLAIWAIVLLFSVYFSQNMK